MLEEQIKTYTTSLIRTVVPILVGNLMGWLAVIGVQLPAEAGSNLSMLLILVTGALFTIGYYALFRRLEQKWPAFGIFLGKAQQPLAYSAAPEADKRTIGIALEATRDRDPDEEGDSEEEKGDAPERGLVDPLLMTGEIDSSPVPREYVARHRRAGKYRAEVDPQ